MEIIHGKLRVQDKYTISKFLSLEYTRNKMKKLNAVQILVSVFAVVLFLSLFFPGKEYFTGYRDTIQIQDGPYFEEISTKCNNFATNVATNLLNYPNTQCTNYCMKPTETWKGSCIGNYLLNDGPNNCMCSPSV